MKTFKAKHKASSLYLRFGKDGNYTLSKNGSLLTEISYKHQIYEKKVALYVDKYTKVYEDTYKIISWSETYKPTRLFYWADLTDFEIEYI